jgi:hypothetical protein
VRNLGVGDAWDVLSGVDYLVARGVADSTRLGSMGWSQGGYISAFLTTTTQRFRAISVGAGISDWMTYYVSTDIHPFTRQYLQATPWDDPAIYAKTSPITYVKQARTPTLIQHGELDRRVPIANAYELFQGLQDVGVPTKLIVYKGFGHGITKPKEQLAAAWHNWQWFSKYLWGEDVPLPAGGDVASVTVQYHDRRTLLMPLKVPIAARTHRALLEELRRRAPRAVELCVYGESLGAWASQNVFRAGGLAALEALRVGRALWIGTPVFSRLRRAFERGRLPSDERVMTVRTSELVAGDPPGTERARYVFLQRSTDPVVLFPGLELAWRRPEWLPAGRWRPGITFLQVVADLVRATNWPAALPQALAHDYRIEGPLAVRLAFGHGTSRDEVDRIADHLVRQEVQRGALLRAARRGYTAPR